jgi:hypothetical protein
VETVLSGKACRLRAVSRANVSITKDFQNFCLRKIRLGAIVKAESAGNVLWQ